MGGIVRKLGPPAVLAVECEKAKRAKRIGEETGLFYVPRVLRFDPIAGVLEYERLDGLRTLFDLACSRHPALFASLRRAGRALAEVHRRLTLPAELQEPLPNEWRLVQGDDVVIHGDFTTENVCLHEPTRRLVIVDWSAARFVGRTPTMGPCYFDITWFARSLFVKVPESFSRLSAWPARRMADSFVRSYAAATGSPFDLGDFVRYRSRTSHLLRDYMIRHQLRDERWCRLPVGLCARLLLYILWRGYVPCRRQAP